MRFVRWHSWIVCSYHLHEWEEIELGRRAYEAGLSEGIFDIEDRCEEAGHLVGAI
jgi:hypothetical protein